MKINNVGPITYIDGTPLTPEDTNTNLAYVSDAGNDVLTKRYSRWINTYQIKNITDASSVQDRTRYLPRTLHYTTDLNLGKTVSIAVPNSVVGSSSLLDCHVSMDGKSLYVLYNDTGLAIQRQLELYTLSTPYDIMTKTYVSKIPLDSAIYGTVNTLTFNRDYTRIFLGRSDGLVYSYVFNEYTFTIGTLSNGINLSADYASIGTFRFYNDLNSTAQVNYVNTGGYYGLGTADGTKIFYTNGSSTNYKMRDLGTAFALNTAGVATTFNTTETVKGLSCSNLGPYYIPGGGLYVSTLRLFSSSTYYTDTLTEINKKALSLTGSTALNMYVHPYGFGAYIVAANNRLYHSTFQTPHMTPQQISVERIIVTAYFTGAFKITFSGFGSTNPDVMFLNGEGNTAETNNTIKWGEFSAKKIELNDSLGGSTAPSMVVSTNTAISPNFSIERLDIEVHYISDRLYSGANSYSEPSMALQQFFASEDTTVGYTEFNAPGKVDMLANINTGLNAGLRSTLFNFRNITTSTGTGARSTRIVHGYPLSATYAAQCVGIIGVITTASGANVPAGTYTATLGGITVTKTVSVAANPIEYFYNGNIGTTTRQDMSSISGVTTSTLTVSNSTATAVNMVVAPIYA